MTECLFVVIGAGASYASTSPENVRGGVSAPHALEHIQASALRPPLVTELFDPRFAGILDKYPIAQWAASDIRKRTTEPVVIEQYLREQLRDSDDPRDLRKFHAVHFYLQDLLWTISNHYTRLPDNYYRLMTGCLRLPKVAFITLNYDTLLDDRLRLDAPIDSMAAYVDSGRNWSLIKLHGSVDWGLPILGPPPMPSMATAPPATIQMRRDEFRLRRGNSIDVVRYDSDTEEFLYPAMSVPTGTRDELACPDAHVEFLRDLMQKQDQLDVLMLGYSALDEEVLTLFRDTGKALRSLCVVNADERTAAEAYGRVTNVLGHPFGIGEVDPRAFESFVGTDALDHYLSRI
ncbi:MAG: hypothetical protein JWQ20_2674 [Conexibacter sp.]|nr:hypothetical protein [Conexibacter sp.]